jgi:hypothetical protein
MMGALVSGVNVPRVNAPAGTFVRARCMRQSGNGPLRLRRGDQPELSGRRRNSRHASFFCNFLCMWNQARASRLIRHQAAFIGRMSIRE